MTGVWPEAPAGPGTAGLTPPRALLPWGERENVLTRGTSAVSGRQDGVSVLRAEAAEARAGVPSAGDRDTRYLGSTKRLKREAAERPGPFPGTRSDMKQAVPRGLGLRRGRVDHNGKEALSVRPPSVLTGRVAGSED